MTLNKTEITTSIIISTIVTSRLTSITKEILIIIPINSATSTPTQGLMIKAHGGYIKTIIGNSVEIQQVQQHQSWEE